MRRRNENSTDEEGRGEPKGGEGRYEEGKRIREHKEWLKKGSEKEIRRQERDVKRSNVRRIERKG